MRESRVSLGARKLARDVRMRRFAKMQHDSMAGRLGNCSSGKVAYASKRAAKERIKQHYTGGFERAYRCAECGNWHLTTHRQAR